ncbi:hypothetical protein OFM36_32795, partial [Escherichia coli]|nr:hypothetical protein [Escherichia coli]
MPKKQATQANQRIRTTGQNSLRFEQRLVLHQWLLGLFGVSSFERLAANLKAPELEGFDENNVSPFYHELCLHTPTDKRPHLPDKLLA